MTSRERTASVILTVAPRLGDEVYRAHFDALIAFLGRLHETAHPDDTVVTIVDPDTRAILGDLPVAPFKAVQIRRIDKDDMGQSRVLMFSDDDLSGPTAVPLDGQCFRRLSFKGNV